MLKNNVIGAFLVLALWQLAATASIFNAVYFASPLETVLEGLKLLRQESFYKDVIFTLGRVLASVGLSILIGVPLGIALGYYASLYQLFNQPIDFFRSIPPIVFYPMLLISLGPGESSRIATATLAASVMIILVVSKELIQRERIRTDYFLALGTKRLLMFRDIVFYEALPGTMVALRAAISWAIVIIVVTEMLVGPKFGLGARVQSVQLSSNIPDLFFTTVIIGLMGVGLNHLIEWLEHKIIFWKKTG